MKQTNLYYFPFSIQIYKKKKEVSLKILCCHNDTWFHLNISFLKPWANQCIFLIEMFVLSFVNVLCIYCILCLQVGSPKGSELAWQTCILYSYIVLLLFVNETIYLYGNLPFFKIHVNCFMARDDSPGAILSFETFPFFN